MSLVHGNSSAGKQNSLLVFKYNNDSSKKQKSYKFSCKGGIEELFFVEDNFTNACADLEIPGEDKFNYFKSILDHRPRAK